MSRPPKDLTSFEGRKWLEGISAATLGSFTGLTFVLFTADAAAPNSRHIAVASSLTLTDGGPGGALTINLSDTGVSAGTYPLVTVDTKGRVTAGTATLDVTHGGTGLTAVVSGDILYASGANTLAALAKSTDGKVLTLVSGLPSWQTPSTGIGGSTGATDNRVLRADGTGGSTVQSSGVTINDDGGIEASTNSLTTAPIKATNSNSAIKAAVLDLNGVDGVNIGLPGSGIGPNGGNALFDRGYVKVRINGLDAENFGDGDQDLFIPIMSEDCFTGDTLVKTPDGERRIDSLKVGDRVMSKNFDINELCENTIKQVSVHATARGYILLNEKLKVSAHHRIWANDSWKRVSEIQIGDYLRNSHWGKVWVFAIDPVQDPQPTYNLVMQNQRMANYFVGYGVDFLMCHNKCPFWFYYSGAAGGDFPWRCQGTFITECDGKTGTTLTKLTHHSSVYYAWEIEPEVSDIEHLELVADGQVLRCLSPLPFTLKQGEKKKLQFEEIPKGTRELLLRATGKYVGTEA